jgi:lipopolysaccharide/colanic/teichoic acid biosynthesis glycosyltransferase
VQGDQLNSIHGHERHPMAVSGNGSADSAFRAYDANHSAPGHRHPVENARLIPVSHEPTSLKRSVSRKREHTPGESINRAMNVALASLGLVVASPVMLVFAVLVKLTSPGPIFYTQTRVGLDRRRTPRGPGSYDRRTRDVGGKPFIILKFRTMRTGAEKNGAVWAARRDPRVTPVGSIMRKYRIDEFPQLLNVLRGDMNIVGPRPERPSIFSQLCDDIADYPLRQRTRPGITGWAQVNQAYDTSIDDVRAKVQLDLEYLERRGVAQDLKIMARTVPVMIFRRGGW